MNLEVLNKPAFKNLSPGKLEIIKQLMQKIEGKTGTEAVIAVVSHLSTIPKTETFSKEEQKVIIECILEDLPKNERAKILNIIKIVSGETF